MSEVLEFTTLPGAIETPSAGDPQVSSAAIAAAAAAAAIRGPTLQSPESQTMQPMPAQPQPDNLPQLPFAGAPLVDTGHVFGAEAYNQLQALGVDLPIAPNQVAPEFAAAYNTLAQTVLDTHQQAQDRMVTAELSDARMKEFAQRLGTPEGQERLMLSMVLNNPDTFNTVMEKVNRIQSDGDYADSQRMRLEAEARFEAAQRMERAINTTQRQSKGQAVESRVERLATQLGVDITLAKNLVASRILQNEAATGTRDITFNEVDATMKSLAAAMGAQPVRTPQVQQVMQQTPQAPVSSLGTPPTPEMIARNMAQPTPTKGPQQVPNSDALDALRNAVRSSVAAARSSGL